MPSHASSLFAYDVRAFALFDDAVSLLDGARLREAYDAAVARHQLRCFAPVGRGLDHIRGVLALRLGLTDEAETWYRTGLAWAERERCPVEQGRCLQGLAEVAERRGQRAEAKQFLDRAAVLFEQQGAPLYLRQVQARTQTL